MRALVVDHVELALDVHHAEPTAVDVEPGGGARLQVGDRAHADVSHGLARSGRGARSSRSRCVAAVRPATARGGGRTRRRRSPAPPAAPLPPAARRGWRGSRAGRRRSGPTVLACEHFTSSASISRLGTDFASAPSVSTRLRLVWNATDFWALRRMRMRPEYTDCAVSSTAPLNRRSLRVLGASWSCRVRKSSICAPSPKYTAVRSDSAPDPASSDSLRRRA